MPAHLYAGVSLSSDGAIGFRGKKSPCLAQYMLRIRLCLVHGCVGYMAQTWLLEESRENNCLWYFVRLLVDAHIHTMRE